MAQPKTDGFWCFWRSFFGTGTVLAKSAKAKSLGILDRTYTEENLLEAIPRIQAVEQALYELENV